MHVRRIMSALVIACAAGLSAACGGDPAGDSAGAAATGATSASAAPTASPSADVKADTERVCTNVVAAFDKEKMALVEVLLKLATEESKADQDKARADATALVGRLKAAVDKETANAADPEVKAALQELMATLGRLLTPEGIADPDFETKMDAAMAKAAAHCPGLDA
jgi:hypothetical protein